MPLIDGRVLAQNIRDQVKHDVQGLGYSPLLNVLLVGDDPASKLYVSLKKKAADEVGISVDVLHLPANSTDSQLVQIIQSWNSDKKVDAILIQIPLPTHLDENGLIAAMDSAKDVDGFHPDNVRALLNGRSCTIPPVHEGILRLINATPYSVNGKQAVIIANTDIFANPLKRLMTSAGMSVDIMLPDKLNTILLKSADIVIIAVGRLKFLQPEMTKEGAVIIDVGTNRLNDCKVRGDADLDAYLEKQPSTWITPVPGGVGPMTIAQLLTNIVKLAKLR